MRAVVCDTGPLLHLSEIDRLDQLADASSLWVSARVLAEAKSSLDDLFA